MDSHYGQYVQKVGELEEITMLLTVYVDDILLLVLCRRIAQRLAVEFELTELGPVKYLLGVDLSIQAGHVQSASACAGYFKAVQHGNVQWLHDARGYITTAGKVSSRSNLPSIP